MIVLELIIFLSTILPIYHMFNALLSRRKRLGLLPVIEEKKFSILIPCFNEENTVRGSIAGLLNMDYSNFEVYYVNDGSEDGTLQVLFEELDLEVVSGDDPEDSDVKAVYRSRRHANFYVIDKFNGGKSEALNTAISHAGSELIVTLDADSVLEKNALRIMNRAFDDPDTVAAGGSIHIIQGYDSLYHHNGLDKKKRFLLSMQILDYLKGFYIYKFSLSKQKATAIISGAFGVFKKSLLDAVGRFRKTVGEDIDITLKIQKRIQKTRQKIVYLPEALCFTQCPETLRDLVKQRMRWQRGFIDCIVHYKWFILRTFAFKSLTFHLFIESILIGLSSCFFTVCSFGFAIALAFGNIDVFVIFSIFYGISVVFNIIYSLTSVYLSAQYHRYPKETMKKLAAIILLDALIFRYFYLAIYLAGTASYFWKQKGKNSWNKVSRVQREFVLQTIDPAFISRGHIGR